ncbi:MAG: DUF192 domain-containing protein [Rickettsiales bacterium]|nr:DUF192 domain-containing protein [Rickettsiales bacterium]
MKNLNIKKLTPACLKSFFDSNFIKFDLKRFIIFIFAGSITGLIIFNAPKSLDAQELKQFNRDPKNYNVKLQILNQNNHIQAEFMIAVADDDYKKIYGLMNLEHLPKNQGMLFKFNRAQIVTMWMKNTMIALDMLFIDSDDIIVNIEHNAQPYSLDIISSQKPVKKVIEINGGISKKLGIEVGQKIKLFK